MKKILLMLVVAASMLTMLNACNTVEGVGQDTKKAGQGIEDAADRNK